MIRGACAQVVRLASAQCGRPDAVAGNDLTQQFERVLVHLAAAEGADPQALGRHTRAVQALGRRAVSGQPSSESPLRPILLLTAEPGAAR